MEKVHEVNLLAISIPTGIKINEAPDLSILEWGAAFNKLTIANNHYRFALGDWMIVGEKFGDEIYQYTDTLRISQGTLDNYKRVALHVPIHIRNNELSWSHHNEVAKLDNHEAQKIWLDRAEQNDWAVRDLREQMNIALINDPQTPAQTKNIIIARDVVKKGLTSLLSDGSIIDQWTKDQPQEIRELAVIEIEQFINSL